MGLKGFDSRPQRMSGMICGQSPPSMFGVTYEKMEKPESVHWPCPTIEHPGTPILHTEKFATADGKGSSSVLSTAHRQKSQTRNIRSRS